MNTNFAKSKQFFENLGVAKKDRKWGVLPKNKKG
jgi:hypothetical protein